MNTRRFWLRTRSNSIPITFWLIDCRCHTLRGSRCGVNTRYTGVHTPACTMPPVLGCTFFNSPPIFFPKFHQHFLPLPLPRAKFLPLRYIHKGVSLMLVFGCWNVGNFNRKSKTMLKTMLRVCYTFRGCAWALVCPMHTLCGYIYTRSVGISLLVYFLGNSYGRNNKRCEGSDTHVFCLWL